MVSRRHTVLALLSGVCLSSLAAANEASTVEEVLVSATRTPKPVSAIPNMVTIISAKDLDEQLTLATDTAGILANLVPGFSPSRQKMSGFGESFRGRSPLYLIDGVPQSNPLRDSSRDGYTIDMAVIERIEVIHGANAIQGLGATGGIINFVTKKPDTSGDLKLGVQAGITTTDDFESDGFEYRGSVYATQKVGKLDYLASVSYHKRGLMYDGQGRTIGVDQTQGDLGDSEQRDFFAKVGFEPTDDQRIQFTINDFKLAGDGDYGTLAGDPATGRPATALEGALQGEPGTNDVTTMSLDYRHGAIAGGTLTFQLYSQDFRASFGGGTFGTFQDPTIAPVGTLFDQSENNSEKFGARMTWDKQNVADTGVNVFTGVDYLQDKTYQRLIFTDRNWVPETKFENIAPFIQAEAPFGDVVTLSGGLRYENAKLKVDDFQSLAGNRASTDYAVLTVEGGSPSFDDLLMNAGIRFEPVEGLTFYSSYAEGFTMPDVGRVLRGVSTPGSSVDSIFDLQPVKADNIELGTTVTMGRILAQASVFQSKSSEGARYVADSDGFLRVQREKTRIRGFEAMVEASVTAEFSLGANISVQEGRVDTDDDGALDADLDAVNIGPNRLNLYAAYQYGAWSARVQLAHLFDRDFSNAADALAAEFNGYDIVDLHVGLQMETGKLQLGVQNLFDKQYITYYSQAGTTRGDRYFAGRGRAITLSYQAEF
ncbi:TonB-dependent receptor [Kordiimonas aestuarii]|uniref:TonB-dependent receptor n=1 Tax=Kordiimonas aestuarii TaxID=1005925 RepID=UPI0021D0CFFF|nr:TonB-dependent receptor [Kordiimonas aestuarii]